MSERWLPVRGWEASYEVSDRGVVRSRDRFDARGHFRRGLTLAAFRSTGGYIFVNLSEAGRRQKRSVHTLVAEAFHGRRPDGLVCRHLNGDPSDNRADNLAWGTPLENLEDAMNHGTWRVRHGERHPRAKVSEEDVALIRRLVRGGITQASVARQFDIDPSTVSNIVRGRNWKHVA